MNYTIENFTEQTGFRFRVSREQKGRIADGTITREQALQEFLESGGLERLQNRSPEIPDSVYQNSDLTLENFSSFVEEATGTARRFRVTGDQKARISAGELTREGALAEVVASRQGEVTEVVETPTENVDDVEYEPVLDN